MSAVGNTSTSKTTIESPIVSIESTIVSIKSPVVTVESTIVSIESSIVSIESSIVSIKSSIEPSCISSTVSIPTDPSSDSTSDSSVISSTLCTIDGRCRAGLVTPSLTLPSKPCTPLLVLTGRSILSVTPLGSSIVCCLTIPLDPVELVSEGQIRTLTATVNFEGCCLSISCLCCNSLSYK